MLFGCSHAPRERVSWNIWLPPLYTSVPVTLHVSVWVEIFISSAVLTSACVTLHVSVWVEIFATRAFWLYDYVTLHVSVWVEIINCTAWNNTAVVTLHVSVWVEIIVPNLYIVISIVTLHVSVWVEIKHSKHTMNVEESRSTWACELKLSTVSLLWTLKSHAPRERVSWNEEEVERLKEELVTLHVSVWVEMFGVEKKSSLPQSRSTWACELKWQRESQGNKNS